MKHFLHLAIGLIVFFHVDHVAGQQRDSVATRFASTITADELRTYLYEFASDEFEGRETGQPGQKKAAAWLADRYAAMGIKPVVNGSYFQTYPLKKESVDASTLKAGGKTYAFADDFFFFNAFAGENPLRWEDLVFVGYGIREAGFDDYADVDVRGKVVLCLSGEPLYADGRSRVTGSMDASAWTYDPGTKLELAKAEGAKALITVMMNFDEMVPRIRFWLESPQLELDLPQSEDPDALPFFFVSPRVANAWMQMSRKPTVEKTQQWINKKGRSRKWKLSRSGGEIHVERNIERIQAENVLCFIPGSDPMLKEEVVVISAHYDHVGIINGEIHNGADDDGSGTVATLELAQAFQLAAREGKGPRRSILILNVSGEEKGLLGSEWYSEYPVFPLEQTVCDLNIDMIGRVDEAHAGNENYVYLIGADKLSTELHALSEQANSTYTGLELDYTFNDPNDPNRFYYRSDHYNFARKNVPVIFYFSGVHEDYHRPGDDAEKILYTKVERITRLIFHTAWEVANRDEKLRVDVLNAFPEK